MLGGGCGGGSDGVRVRVYGRCGSVPVVYHCMYHA